MCLALGYRASERLPQTEIELCGTFKLFQRENNERQQRPPVARSLETYLKNVLEPHADDSDPNTLADGVKARMGRKPKPVLKGTREQFLSEIKAFVRKELVNLGLKPLEYMYDTTFESWLENTHYPKWRKDELVKYKEEITNLLERNEHGQLVRFVIKLFMKDEFYVDYKPARGIYARDDAAKIFFGPWFKAIENQVYSLPDFIKHVPVRQRPKYIYERLYRPGGVYVATDYSKFENHFTKDLMDSVEFVLYDYMLSGVCGGKEVLSIMREVLQGDNKIYNKFLKAIIQARRMSGEMNTSLGNGFSNLMFMKFICHKLDLECCGVVEGDDGLFVFVGGAPTTQDFVDYGFDIKLATFTEISKASFCGNLFDETDLSIITCPYDVLSTFGWTTRRYSRANKNTLRLLLKSKALSLAHQYPGCPILGNFSQYVLRCLRSYDIKGFNERRRDLSMWEREQLNEAILFKGRGLDEDLYQEPKIGTRLLFEELYGITVETQLMIERSLDQLTTLTALEIPLISEYAPAAWKDYYSTYVIELKPDEKQCTSYYVHGT